MSPSGRRRSKVPLLAYRILVMVHPTKTFGASKQVCMGMNRETLVVDMHLDMDAYQRWICICRTRSTFLWILDTSDSTAPGHLR
jgi:hypothetical protein